LRGGSAEENAQTIRAVLTGERRDAARDLVVINAAAALHVSGKGETLSSAVELAGQVIDSGAAAAKLEALRRFSSAV
jgi:anthranilate phosphoribosyltransferase